MAPQPTSGHAAVGAWFLGPRAENFDILEKIFKEIISGQAVVRKTLYGSDPDFISESMKKNELFTANIQRLTDELRAVSYMLSQHSVPFWSPRYNAHMSVESSMPGVIGCEFFTALMSLQNSESFRFGHYDVQSKQRCPRSKPFHYIGRERGRTSIVWNAGLQQISLENSRKPNWVGPHNLREFSTLFFLWFLEFRRSWKLRDKCATGKCWLLVGRIRCQSWVRVGR